MMMKLSFLFFLQAIALTPFYENLNQYYEQQNYICEQVLDGDTVKLRGNGKSIKLRLAYIDTPELNQSSLDGVPVGKMITHYLRQLIEGEVVSVRLLKRDIYGRWLGEVYWGNQFINLLLIERGFAVLYPKAIFRSRIQMRKFLQAYSDARRHNLGIWKTVGMMNPYHFRKMSKK